MNQSKVAIIDINHNIGHRISQYFMNQGHLVNFINRKYFRGISKDDKSSNNFVVSECNLIICIFVNTKSKHDNNLNNFLLNRIILLLKQKGKYAPYFIFLTSYKNSPALAIKKLYNYTILRLPEIYGPGVQGGLISKIINNRIDGRVMYLKNKYCDYAYIDDLIKGVCMLIDKNEFNRRTVYLYSIRHILVSDICNKVNRTLPTSYGKVFVEKDNKNYNRKSIFKNLIGRTAIDIDKGIANTVFYAQSKEHCEMDLEKDPQKYIFRNEILAGRLFGSSSGHLLIVKNKVKKNKFVRKLAVRYGVEGNGIPKLKAEIEFYKYISKRKELINLKQVYPMVLKIMDLEKHALFDIEYIGNGKNIVTLLSEYHAVLHKQHKKLLNNLLDIIIPNGYLIDGALLDEKQSISRLDDYYLRRVASRLNYLNFSKQKIDFKVSSLKKISDLFNMEQIIINDEICTNPRILINRINCDDKLIELFRPRFESFCVHGDMTFLNMVYDSKRKRYILIDPRGFIGNWDPIYDFGKLKFTFSGFGKLINNEYELSELNSDKFVVNFTGDKSGIALLEKLNNSFLDDLYNNYWFRKLIEYEPFWRYRIKFAEAMHYLADVPYRLNIDQSARSGIATFLLGTKCLNNILNDLQCDKIMD